MHSVRATIRPFRVSVPEADLADLRRRVKATTLARGGDRHRRIAGRAARDDAELARYWATEYDWRKVRGEAQRLPAVRHQHRWGRHPFHSRPFERQERVAAYRHARWPGSIIEQMKIIDPLTNPTAHGGSAGDAFDIVIPSLRATVFRQADRHGWDPPRIARAWTTLMKRLGYTQFVAQGGDGGMPSRSRWRCRRLRDCSAFPPTWRHGSRRIAKALAAGGPPPAEALGRGTQRVGPAGFLLQERAGLRNEMALRPQTLYAIADSPVGLAAWILDHDGAATS